MGLTWNVSKVPVDAEVGVRGDDATLEDLLTHHRGEGVLGCVHVGLDQPGVLRTFEGEHGGDLHHTLRQNHQQHLGIKGLFGVEHHLHHLGSFGPSEPFVTPLGIINSQDFLCLLES